MYEECQLAANGIYCGSPEGRQDPRVPVLMEGADQWKLLVQVDSDDGAGMMWGDMGRLYFWIRREDPAEARFDRVWMVLQCS